MHVKPREQDVEELDFQWPHPSEFFFYYLLPSSLDLIFFMLRLFDQHCLVICFQGRFDEVQKAPKRPTKAPREIKDLVSILLRNSCLCFALARAHTYIFTRSVFLAQGLTFFFSLNRMRIKARKVLVNYTRFVFLLKNDASFSVLPCCHAISSYWMSLCHGIY